jgi:hypothetical protein
MAPDRFIAVVLMSATVLTPAFLHDNTSVSVRVSKRVGSSKYPMRRRTVTDRMRNGTSAG